MQDERHPLDRAYSELREATLRRAAARELDAEDTARIIIQREPESVAPRGVRRKVAAVVSGLVGALYGLWELYNLFRGHR